jgi:carbohydrate-binding DOMON domain-containing protein
MQKLRLFLLAGAAVALLAGTALAAKVEIEDPKGDDYGPGEYVYPTDAVYAPGSFDLTDFEMEIDGENVTIECEMNSRLEDPWRMGGGFSVQMLFVLIDNQPGGHTTTPPGLNLMVDESTAWDKCIILSPQTMARVKQEVEAKAADMAADIIVPQRVKGSRSTIEAKFKASELGGKGDPSTWKYQVLVQSNEGFPSGGDLLTRKVNEFEGQHRFGGGTDFDCDPHVMDILGDHAQLKHYECAEDGTTKKHAVIKLVMP